MKRILTAICLVLLCAMFIVSCDSSSNSNSLTEPSYNYNNGYNTQTSISTNANNTINNNVNNNANSNNSYNNNYGDNDVAPMPTETETRATSATSSTTSTCLVHSWKSATCTEPKTCSKCGATDGEAKGHSYESYNDYKCDCGEVDPKVTETLAKCSLELPNLPQEVKRYGYNNSLQSSVSVTKIVPTFEYYGYNDKNEITLTVKFSGTKTYDYQGSNQSSRCYIGWKLYDPDGNVFRSGTFSSSNVAMGESFANKEETLIHNFEAAEPGAYKLVLLDVN